MKILRTLLLACVAVCLIGAGDGAAKWIQNLYLSGSSGPSASSSGQSSVYFDSSMNGAEISNNGGAFYSIQDSRNIVINGDFAIDQRGELTNASATAYAWDRWNLVQTTPNSGTYSTSNPNGFLKAAMVPALSDVNGMTNMGQITCTHVNTTLQAGCSLVLRTTIENADIPWNAANEGMVLSFYAQSSAAFNMGVAVMDVQGTKGVMKEFEISNTALTRYFFVIPPISAVASGGTVAGLEIDFCLVGGTNFQGTASSTFSATIFNGGVGGVAEYCTSAQSNLGGVNATAMQITGVKLEAGQCATSYKSRPYQQELALCQRYCYVITPVAIFSNQPICTGTFSSATALIATLQFPVQMRVAPTFLFAGTIGHLEIGNGTGNWPATTNPPVSSFTQFSNSAASLTVTASTGGAAANQSGYLFWTSGSSSDMLIFNADY